MRLIIKSKITTKQSTNETDGTNRSNKNEKKAALDWAISYTSEIAASSSPNLICLKAIKVLRNSDEFDNSIISKTTRSTNKRD